MNLVFANASKKWGGVKSWTLDVAAGLRERGHRVLLLARPGEFLRRAALLGCETCAFTFGPDYNPVAILRAARELQRFGAQVVCGNVGKDLRTVGLAARILGIPVVHRVGLAGDLKPGPSPWLDAQLLRPYLLAPCQQVLDGVRHAVPALRPLPAAVIHTGKRRGPCPEHGPHTPLALVSASQLNPDKGHATVLAALERLAGSGIPFHYHVYGTGSLQDSLPRHAQDLGLADHVTWHGFVPDVPARIAQADVFVLASTSEGLPNALVEAMAAGLVCVARNVGGIAEIWPPAAHWLLLPPDAGPEAFAEALLRLTRLCDEEFRLLRQAFWQAVPSREAMLDALEAFVIRLEKRA
ncbi:glycosyl transferase [Thermodesulfomicrobium sp. WS]|uniref:glycosyltransferase n=1 Tax=Thermodesulfomicrobium sp. WS TaxID=3004129 RepID=UPI002490CB55|nr:glycosyltransferase [Thermodesulfomicrobium sp. WS]BDV01789.1 glycosyl transferase [Thermodesulfomicrobium sp. WS]